MPLAANRAIAINKRPLELCTAIAHTTAPLAVGRTHSLFVRQRAGNGAKHSAAGESHDEEAPYVAHAVAIVLIQVVDVGALEPVAGCKEKVAIGLHGCEWRLGV